MKSSKLHKLISKELPYPLLTEEGEARFAQVLQALPAKLPQGNRKKPHSSRWKKGLRISFACTAAALVLLVSLNAAFPAVAESIPVLGSVFRYINDQNTSLYFNREKAARMEERGLAVTESTAAAGDGEIYFSVKESYYDGAYLYAAAQLYAPFDPNGRNVSFDYKISINGVEMDFAYNESSRDWVPVGENNYLSDQISTHIPLEYRPEPGDLQVEYAVTIYDLTGGAEGSPGTVLGKTKVLFTAVYDPRENILLDQPVEKNGFRFRSFHSSVSRTELVMDCLRSDTSYYECTLFRPDGSPLEMDSSSSSGSDVDPDAITLTVSGAGLDQKDRLVVIQLSHKDSNVWIRTTDPLHFLRKEVLAEFTVDLEKGTVVASQRYRDWTDPLYWNPEAIRASKCWAFPSYRAEDGALSHLGGNYKVEFLTKSNNYGFKTYLNLVTDQPYRELRGELWTQGKLLQSGLSLETLEDAQERQKKSFRLDFPNGQNAFYQPFAQYDPQVYDRLRHPAQDGESLDFTGWTFLTGAELPRGMEKSSLFVQTMFLEGPLSFLEVNQDYQVRLYDAQTQELVHEERIRCSLPETAKAEPHQVFLRLPGWGRPYVLLEKDWLS